MKNNRLRLRFLTYFAVIAFFCSCGGDRIVKPTQAIADFHDLIVIENTGTTGRPDWTDNITFFKDNQGLHFTGGVMGGVDYALTIRLAKAQAIKGLLESIEIKARSEFSTVLGGKNRNESDIGRYVTDAVAWTIENIKISGIRQRKLYYEKVLDPISQIIGYNTWVELEISDSDYAKAKVKAAERLRDQALEERDEDSRRKAEELLDKLRTQADEISS